MNITPNCCFVRSAFFKAVKYSTILAQRLELQFPRILFRWSKENIWMFSVNSEIFFLVCVLKLHWNLQYALKVLQIFRLYGRLEPGFWLLGSVTIYQINKRRVMNTAENQSFFREVALISKRNFINLKTWDFPEKRSPLFFFRKLNTMLMFN